MEFCIKSQHEHPHKQISPLKPFHWSHMALHFICKPLPYSLHPLCFFCVLQAPNAKINLSAAKSSSANGAILSYLWQITPVGSSTPIITASNPVVTVPAPPAGSYNVTLEVWDVVGGHDSQTTSLSVDAANVLDWWSETPVFVTSSTLVVPPPTAVIAVNGTTTDIVNIKAPAAGPVLVTIDGSKSSDQRGTQLAYSWAIAQTEPSVKQLDVVLPYAEPAKFAYR